MRLFTAVELNETVRTELVRVQNELQRAAAGSLRMVAPENLHLTLKFLGELDNSLLKDVEEIVREAALSGERFHLTPGSGGVFPSRGTPRVCWAGFESSSAALAELAARLEADFEILDIEKETRPYTPHVTIARAAKGPVDGDLIRRRLSEIRIERLTQEVREITLFSSTLSQHGSRYEVVGRYSFG